MKKIFSIKILFLFSLFPWTTFGLINIPGSENSIIPLILLFAYLFFNKIKKINDELILLYVLFAIGFVISFLLTSDLNIKLMIRSFYNYFIFCVLLLIFSQEKDVVLKDLPKYIFFANILWLIFGFVQYFGFYEYNFASRFSGITGLNPVVAGRGFNSFAPEPSFFAIFLVFSIWIIFLKNDFNYKKFTKFETIILFLNIFTIFFVSKSIIGVAILMIFFFLIFAELLIKYFLKLNNKYLLIIFIVFFVNIIFYLYYFFYSIDATFDNRSLNFLANLAKNPYYISEIFYTDQSVSSRIENILFPITGFLQNYTMPGGLSGYNFLRDDINFFYNYIFDCNTPECEKYFGTKIMSIFSDILFQLGIFGLIIIILTLKVCYNAKIKFNISNLIFTFIMFLQAAPITYILYSFMIIYISNYKKN